MNEYQRDLKEVCIINVFDIFSQGHIAMVKKCLGKNRETYDKMTVMVPTDRAVFDIAGSCPVVPFEIREKRVHDMLWQSTTTCSAEGLQKFIEQHGYETLFIVYGKDTGEFKDAMVKMLRENNCVFKVNSGVL